jgi:uncharacterized protein YbjT (DUF2867 family)
MKSGSEIELSDSKEIHKILVIGGTGLVGKPVVLELLSRGFEVSVGVRHSPHTKDWRQVSPPDAMQSVLLLDVTKPETLKQRFDGFEAIFLSLPSGPRYEDCFRVGVEGTVAVVEEARKAGVQRLNFLSGASNLGSDNSFPPIRAKWQAEEAIKASGIPFTIWRANWFMETLTRMARFGMIGRPGNGEVATHWLAGEDFGRMVANGLSSNETVNKTLYAFGPELVSLKQGVETYQRICYPRSPIVPIPLGFLALGGRISGSWDVWFGAQMMQYLSKEPEIGDPSEADRLVGKATITIEEFSRKILQSAENI